MTDAPTSKVNGDAVQASGTNEEDADDDTARVQCVESSCITSCLTII